MMGFRRHISQGGMSGDVENLEFSEDAFKDCGKVGNVRITPLYSEEMDYEFENSFHLINESNRNAANIPMTVFRINDCLQDYQNCDAQPLEHRVTESINQEPSSSFSINSSIDNSCIQMDFLDKVNQWLWCLPRPFFREGFTNFSHNTCCNNSLRVNFGSGSSQTDTDNRDLLHSSSIRFSPQTYNYSPPIPVNFTMFNEAYESSNSYVPAAPPPSFSSCFEEHEEPLITSLYSNSEEWEGSLISSPSSNCNSEEQEGPLMTSTRRSPFQEYRADDLWATARSFSNVEEASLEWDGYRPHFGIHVIQHQQGTADGVILNNVGHLV